MARLNEPMGATESIETLRRKFLRQNRDIARINSTQSLKIRSLENECARMLSDNLDLRGRILRLETELQESRAQRIADHALEIKEKMEARLLEWGEMLASLGSEPIPKHRSPRLPKKAKTRPSMVRTSPPQWRRRSSGEIEAAALQEGRLPPLWENKPCPRETLNREEILALCSEAAETTDSPDLGPPPVSRFVDEDPVKIDLPVRSPSVSPKSTSIEASFSKPMPKGLPISPPSFPKKTLEIPKDDDFIVNKVESKQPKQSNPAQPELVQSASAPILAPQPTVEAVKAGSKRKSREDDEKENARSVRNLAGDMTKAAESQPEKSSTVESRPISRPIKELPARKEARQKTTGTVASAGPRKPLGARSANETVGSEKKSAKAAVLDEVAKAKAEAKREEQAKDKTRQKRKEESKKKEDVKEDVPVEQVPIPEPAPPAPITSIEVEPETVLSAEANLFTPMSPEPAAAPREELQDTPPPAGISSQGEMSRGSRRNRAAISYAEPNLRDKMRRPTKQLFDAVAGEGKSSMRRSSQSKGSDVSGPSSAVKTEEKKKDASWKDLPVAESSASAEEAPASPLVLKTSRKAHSDLVPLANGAADKKKHSPSNTAQGSESDSAAVNSAKLPLKSTNRRLEEIAAREVEVAEMFEESPDVYDFSSSSPSNPARHANPDDVKRGSSTKGHSRSRRQSSIVIREEDLGHPDRVADAGEKSHSNSNSNSNSHSNKSTASRKRASMMAQKVSRMDPDENTDAVEGDSLTNTSSAEADGRDSNTKLSMRRRSMML